MAWSKPADLTGSWLSDEVLPDTAKITVWLDKAEREIRRKVPGIQARIEAEANETPAREDLLKDAIDVAVEMVTRVFLNPNRQRTVSENIGTGPISESRSITMGGENPGKLYLATDELEKLQPEVKRGQAFEINLIPVDHRGPDSWLC